MVVQHPYYPLDLQLPEYQPPLLDFQVVLAITFGSFGGLVVLGWLMSGRFKLLTSERLWVCWFLTTGAIHLFIEGSVVARSKFFADTTGDIFSEIWKEYAKADSRYASRDAFTIEMELVTAYLEGPACFLIVYGLLLQRPWRFTAMLLVSCGQLYGDVLYFLTCWHDGFTKYSRPEAMYFYFYFIFVNSIWIFIPLACIISAARQVNACVAASGALAKKKANKSA